MAVGLISAPFAVEDIDEAKIEGLKDKDTIGEMLHEVAEQMPRIKVPLIDERDQFLMSKIQEAPGKKIVGVVGAAHVAGMVTQLGKSANYDELSKIPPPGKLVGALKWIIPAVVMAAFYLGWKRHGGVGLEQMLYAWIIPNAVCAGLLTALALAHPLTILAAFVASPITSLNPTIGAGMVAGLVEAYLRKPTVEDCENVQYAVTSVKGLYKNRVTRVLLVAVMATLGSALGAWIGAPLVLRLL